MEQPQQPHVPQPLQQVQQPQQPYVQQPQQPYVQQQEPQQESASSAWGDSSWSSAWNDSSWSSASHDTLWRWSASQGWHEVVGTERAGEHWRERPGKPEGRFGTRGGKNNPKVAFKHL